MGNNKEQYILAHDLGTSGNKATLYGVDGTLRCSVVCDYPTYTPQDRFVEQDPMDWWGAARANCWKRRRLRRRRCSASPSAGR